MQTNSISQSGNPKDTPCALHYSEHHGGRGEEQAAGRTPGSKLTTNACQAFKNFQSVIRASPAQNTVLCILDRMSTHTGKRWQGSSSSQFQTKSLNPWVCEVESTSLTIFGIKSFPQENNRTNSMFLLGSELSPEVTCSALPSRVLPVQGRKLASGCAGPGVGRPALL